MDQTSGDLTDVGWGALLAAARHAGEDVDRHGVEVFQEVRTINGEFTAWTAAHVFVRTEGPCGETIAWVPRHPGAVVVIETDDFGGTTTTAV